MRTEDRTRQPTTLNPRPMIIAAVSVTKALGNGSVRMATPAGVVPGQNMTMFINMPSTQGWDYIQAFALEGAAKNYRWSGNGYHSTSVIPGEWNSIVVPIPADFVATGSVIGLQIGTTSAATIKVYVDGISFGS